MNKQRKVVIWSWSKAHVWEENIWQIKYEIKNIEELEEKEEHCGSGREEKFSRCLKIK